MKGGGAIGDRLHAARGVLAVIAVRTPSAGWTSTPSKISPAADHVGLQDGADQARVATP